MGKIQLWDLNITNINSKIETFYILDSINIESETGLDG